MPPRSSSAYEYRLQPLFWSLRRVSRSVLRVAIPLLIGVGILGIYEYRVMPRTVEAIHSHWHQLWRSAGFRVEQFDIKGRQRLPLESVQEMVQVNQGAGLFEIDLDAVRDRLEAHPLVASATVRRQWPTYLILTLTERQPFALWQDDTKNQHVIARDGTILPLEMSVFESMTPMIVSGTGARDHLDGLVAKLAPYQDLHPHLRTAVWVGERRWRLGLDTGLMIDLPAYHVPIALERLMRLVVSDNLLARAVKRVDLRQTDRVIIEPLDDAEELITRPHFVRQDKRRGV